MKDFLGRELSVGDFVVSCNTKNYFRVSHITAIDPEGKFFFTSTYSPGTRSRRTAPWSFLKIDPPESFIRAYQEADELLQLYQRLTNGEFETYRLQLSQAVKRTLEPWKDLD